MQRDKLMQYPAMNMKSPQKALQDAMLFVFSMYRTLLTATDRFVTVNDHFTYSKQISHLRHQKHN